MNYCTTYEYEVCGNDELIHRLSDNALTIINNEPKGKNLNVVMIHCNPCKFQRRKFLSENFRDEMLKTPNVELCVVELVYDNQYEIPKKYIVIIVKTINKKRNQLITS